MDELPTPEETIWCDEHPEQTKPCPYCSVDDTGGCSVISPAPLKKEMMDDATLFCPVCKSSCCTYQEDYFKKKNVAAAVAWLRLQLCVNSTCPFSYSVEHKTNRRIGPVCGRCKIINEAFAGAKE